MTILRQSYLGRKLDKQLCLQKGVRSHAAEFDDPRPGHISILPDELLSNILSYIPPKTGDYLCKPDQRKDSVPLTLVCKTWRRIDERTLFRSITTRHPASLMLSRLRTLLEIFETRPHIQDYPREVHISMHRTPHLLRAKPEREILPPRSDPANPQYPPLITATHHPRNPPRKSEASRWVP